MSQDIIVVGGGASGLVAAIVAARNGANVLLLEQKDKIGRKILATGNGKCNYTNYIQEASCYRGEDASFASCILTKFGLEQTLDFFGQLGIYPKSKHGYLYPNSEQASSILEVLQLELERLRVKIKTREKIIKIKKQMDLFSVETETYEYQANKVILSTGGMASPQFGCGEIGYNIAQTFGHSIVTPVPALVGLKSKDKNFPLLAGIRIESKLSLIIDNHTILEEIGEVQFTNYGISGIPVFQVSRFATVALLEKKEVKIFLDFMPKETEEQVFDLLCEYFYKKTSKTLEQAMIGLFPKKLIPVLLEKTALPYKMLSNTIEIKQVKQLVHTIKEYFIPIYKSNGFDQAQVTAGGVRTEQIDERTLQSKLVSGIYFTGEIIDIDGKCGGYNLQWAWSTGYIAGFSAAVSNSYKKGNKK